MTRSAHQRDAWNDGVHGYQQAIYTLSLQPIDSPRFAAPSDDVDYAPVLVLQQNDIIEIRDFFDHNGFRLQPTYRQHGLLPDVVGDQASSFVGMPSIAPAERLAVTHRFGGTTQTYRLQNGELALTGHLQGLDTLSGVRFPLRTFRGAFVPGCEMLAQVHGQLGVLHVAELNANGTDVATVGQVAFPVPIADAVVGPGGDGVVVRSNASLIAASFTASDTFASVAMRSSSRPLKSLPHFPPGASVGSPNRHPEGPLWLVEPASDGKDSVQKRTLSVHLVAPPPSM